MAKRVLYIEDNDDNRTLIKMFFRKVDDEVILAHSAERALELMQEDSFDVILLDVNLAGGMSSVDFLRTIQGDEQKKAIPVVLVSGLSSLSTVDGLQRTWYNAFLPKPFTKQQMFDLLDEVVG